MDSFGSSYFGQHGPHNNCHSAMLITKADRQNGPKCSVILLQVDPEQLQVLAGEMEKGDRNFDYMYTFGAYNDGVTLQAVRQ